MAIKLRIRLTMKAREAAWNALNQILGEKKTSADVAIDNVLKHSHASSDERPFTNQLVLGTLRQLSWLDYSISPHLKAGINKTPMKTLNVLRLGVYQILFIDVVPIHAAVSETVRLAKNVLPDKIAGFINAVLRRVAERYDTLQFTKVSKPPGMEQADWFALHYSFPLWMVQHFIAAWGMEEAEKFCIASNEEPRMTLRINTLKTSIESVQEELESSGFEIDENVSFPPEALRLRGSKAPTMTNSFQNGHFYIQDIASQLVAHILHPQPGDNICDICAAPGGKTTHIAQLSDDKANIFALDISSARCNLIEENKKRLGLQNVKILVKTKKSLEMLRKQTMNRVLVDAPCSGLGTIRRHPEIKWHRKKKDIERFSASQLKILEEAALLVAPGGILVYSTCTVLPDENQNIITKFIKTNPEFEIDDLTSSKIANEISHDGSAALAPAFLQLLPHRHSTDGFFIARMRRNII